ncbi:unnamed protein product [Paramecium sonneborni]|uniref:RING-type domain-containing protein n=1 Tax=Paramecium sonneborni TaxID=65129 RepID=A0A8S1RUE7_9CILI|nr:unnamed protein product [Paramecium sonneborni]
MKIAEKQRKCSKCYHQENNNILSFPKCNHEICRSCLRNHFEKKINESQFQIKFLVFPICLIQRDNIEWFKQIVDQKKYDNYYHLLLKHESMKTNEIYVKCKNKLVYQNLQHGKMQIIIIVHHENLNFAENLIRNIKKEQYQEKVEKLDSYITYEARSLDQQMPKI